MIALVAMSVQATLPSAVCLVLLALWAWALPLPPQWPAPNSFSAPLATTMVVPFEQPFPSPSLGEANGCRMARMLVFVVALWFVGVVGGFLWVAVVYARPSCDASGLL